MGNACKASKTGKRRDGYLFGEGKLKAVCTGVLEHGGREFEFSV